MTDPSSSDYNHLSEISGISAQPLPAEQQTDKSIKPLKIFKLIVIGDTGKMCFANLQVSASRVCLKGLCQTNSRLTTM
jgi:hypothetical protein